MEAPTNLFIDFKETFNKLYQKYSKHKHLWIEIETKFSMLHAYFHGHYETQKYLGYDVEGILNHVKEEDILKQAKDDELNYLISRLTEIYDTIIKLPKIEYNKLWIENTPKKSNYIFIGHGHNLVWARLALFLSEELDLKVVYYESDCHTGESINEVIEEFIDKVGLAFLVFSAEDETKDGTKRAR